MTADGAPAGTIDVFLSHDSDDMPWVRTLYTALETLGVSVWFDERELPGAGNWVLGISEDGLSRCRFLVLIVTRRSLERPWVKGEWTSFMAKYGPVDRVIPVFLEEVSLPTVLAAAQGIKVAGRTVAEVAALIARRVGRAKEPPGGGPAATSASAAAGLGPHPPALHVESDLGSPAGVALHPPGLLRYYFDRWLPRLHRFLTRRGLLARPEELREVEDYLRKVQAAMHAAIHRKTYVPLTATPAAPSPVEEGMDEDPFHAPVRQFILQLVGASRGGDSASAPIAAVNRRSRLVRNLLRALARSVQPLILLGEPGSGKTMTLQRAVQLLAEDEGRRVFPCLPVYVRLGEFHVEGGVDERDVREYVKRSLPAPIRRRFEDLEDEERLFIFFDGMDEMSRDRYGDHTAALSLFADASPARTLFSCRITDFSPRFLHHRLVLLPFDYRQVVEYLRLYLSFPVTIDGRSWGLKRLAKEVVGGDLPMEANNPFVLWLLCLYLKGKGSWPDTRVALLRFYNEQNYRRKEEEERRQGRPGFPPMEAAFREWGRFGFVITGRNRGPTIPVADLEAGQDISAVREMIRVGKRCALLAESIDGHEHLVRFEHHRFQEFFTALYIHATRPDVDWLGKLDAPRWQETMLNLILMDENAEVAGVLAGAIAELVRLSQAEIDRVQAENRRRESVQRKIDAARRRKKARDRRLKRAGKRAPMGSPEPEVEILEEFPEEQETVLADRVELSSRLLRQCRGPASKVREALMPPFRKAVSLLGGYGNPITQVKMMRACQNVPEIDAIEALRKPLHSPIGWVRKQALLLMGVGKGNKGPIGSDLPTEMGYDLANGLFLTRLSTYWKAARASLYFPRLPVFPTVRVVN
jgi:hypothetical protein